MNDDILTLLDTRPQRADAQKNRELLLCTARRMFAEYGFEAVSMSAIAEAAGVGKGTLYRHFANKTELCFTLLDSEQFRLQERTLNRLRAHPDPVENLRWFLDEVTWFIDEHAAMLYVVEPNTDSPLEHAAHLWWRQTIFNLLQQAGYQGDIAYAADVLYIMTGVHAILFQRRKLGYSLERIRNGINDTLTAFLHTCA